MKDLTVKYKPVNQEKVLETVITAQNEVKVSTVIMEAAKKFDLNSAEYLLVIDNDAISFPSSQHKVLKDTDLIGTVEISGGEFYLVAKENYEVILIEDNRKIRLVQQRHQILVISIN